MGLETALMVVAALVMSVVLTGLMRKISLAHGVLDIPNERSSHVSPTPRGGGVAIVVVVFLALIVLLLMGKLQSHVFLAFMGGVVVASVGFADDRYGLPARVRLTAHAVAAIWALLWLGGVPSLPLTNGLIDLGWAGYVLGALGIVWTLNLFNFMDGIDGIAASEAIFITVAGSVLSIATGTSSAVSVMGLIFGAACCGFLLWNWPPAKIFMGDVGSGFVGYGIALLALATAHETGVALFVWVILGGVFFVDATVTLVRRVSRGEQASQAHRTHAYQRLALRWGSHRRVTVGVLVVNVAWLLPCATIATLYPRLACRFLVLALVPLVIVAIAAGAGDEDAMTKKKHPTP